VGTQPSFEEIESLLTIGGRDQGEAFRHERGEQEADQRGIIVDDKDARFVGRFTSNREVFPHAKNVSRGHSAHKLTCELRCGETRPRKSRAPRESVTSLAPGD